MFNPIALSPEHEKDAEILNKLTRDRYSKLEQSEEWKRRGSLQDGAYSLTRLLSAMRSGTVEKDAPYEAAESRRIAERSGRPAEPGYEYLPIDGRRDLSAASNPQLAPTDVGALFVNFLDQFFDIARLGITRLTLERPATIPSISGNVSSFWLANEGSTITESDFTFATSTSSPKHVGASIEISDRFLKQGSDFAQRFVWQALARAVAAELSRKIITGTGLSGQISGIFAQTGTLSLPAASANLTLVNNAISAIEIGSAMLTPAAAGFVMGASPTKLFRSRESFSGAGALMVGNNLQGYPVITTEAASPNAMIFADWSQLCLLEFGLLQVSTDPYGVNSALFKTGQVGLKCLWMIDVVCLNPKSFIWTGALS